jgi:uncharacterized protein YkwD
LCRGRRFAALVLVVLGAAACSGSTTLESSKDASHESLDSEEQAMVLAVNDRRVANGVPVVTACSSLSASASHHSDDMRDHKYLSDVGKDGSTVRSRGCDAGYAPGCDQSAAMAELVSDGIAEPDGVVTQWLGDANTKAILLSPKLVIAGIGRAEGAAPPVWTLDLASADDASCKP